MARPHGSIAPQQKQLSMRVSSDQISAAGGCSDADAGPESGVADGRAQRWELRATVAVRTYNVRIDCRGCSGGAGAADVSDGEPGRWWWTTRALTRRWEWWRVGWGGAAV